MQNPPEGSLDCQSPLPAFHYHVWGASSQPCCSCCSSPAHAEEVWLHFELMLNSVSYGYGKVIAAITVASSQYVPVWSSPQVSPCHCHYKDVTSRCLFLQLIYPEIYDTCCGRCFETLAMVAKVDLQTCGHTAWASHELRPQACTGVSELCLQN